MYKKYHLSDHEIPDNYCIYVSQAEVMGVHHRKTIVSTFCKATGQDVFLEPEPDNYHDCNAIKIIGTWDSFFWKRRRLLGYVSRDLAKQIHDDGLEGVVRARLLKTYLGNDGYVEVFYQLIAPREFVMQARAKHDPYAAFKYHLDSDRTVEAEAIMLSLIEEGERASAATCLGVNSKPYLKLAQLYHRLKRYTDELNILERYARQHQQPGTLADNLATRLLKVRSRLGGAAGGTDRVSGG